MNALDLARTAYSSNAAPIRTTRGTEYNVFAQVTHRLRATAANRKADFPGYVRALTDNRRLWTLLASDVADASNDLPKEVRAQIFYLAEFTIQHTAKILSRQADIEALIDVNTAIMRGLNRDGGSR